MDSLMHSMLESLEYGIKGEDVISFINSSV
jgi:hypothetical protein